MKYLFLLLFLSLTAFSSAQTVDTIPASDPLIEYTGRIDFTNPDAPAFSYSGVSVRACFTGTSIGMILDDDVGKNYYNVILDGRLLDTIRVTTGKKIYDIGAGLADTVHEVEIFKRTEEMFGKTGFYGFIVDDGDSLTEITGVRDRLIEYIGNSITCGYGNEGALGKTFGPTTENHYMTYAAVTSRNFSARHLAVCKSGIGIYRNYNGPAGGNTDCMTNNYKRIFFNDEEPEYSFAETPDLVCINLGTNDFSTGGGDSALFVSNYLRLIDTIRTKYDHPDILCLLGPMLSGGTLDKVRDYLTFIADSADRSGNGHVYLFEMSQQTGDLGIGIDYHPTVAQHIKNGLELSNYISTIKGWKITPLVLNAATVDSVHIRVEFNIPVVDPENGLAGFTVSGDEGHAIDSIYPDTENSSQIYILLQDSLVAGEEVSLSYRSGTVRSEDSVMLGDVNRFGVTNNLVEKKNPDDPAVTVTVDLSDEHQLIRGFGGANVPGWIPDMNADAAGKIFGNAPGQLGLSILRVRISPDPNQFFREVPTAVRAFNYGAIILGSPWTPPAYMKSNDNLVGGSLLPGYYGAYTDHLLDFASYMKNNGAPLYAISLQNEPDISVSYESCDWTPQQMIDYLKGQGPRFDTLRVMAAESFNFNHAKTDPILNDTGAVAQVDIIGGHIYGSGLEDYPLAREKGKEVWMTEHFTDSDHDANQWPLALDLGEEINQCMEANFNAYIWWYIKRYYGLIKEDGNLSKRGFIMSHFSKFIRPGWIRVGTSMAPVTGISLTAYKTDSTLAIVVVNMNRSTDITFGFDIQNGTADSLAQYTTSETKQVMNDGWIHASGGSFNATFGARSITTLTTYAVDAGKAGNVLPVADAGGDREIFSVGGDGTETVTLDGSGSHDPDGRITNFSWSRNGAQISLDTAFTVHLGAGEFTYVLTVTDDDGALQSDTVTITVSNPYHAELWFEAECGRVGSNWTTKILSLASEGRYVMVTPGFQNIQSPSSDTADYIVFPFHIDEAGPYKLWARVLTPTADDDSYWIRMDEGTWANWNNIDLGSNWHWDDLHDQNNFGETVVFQLDTGYHELTVCFREDGTRLDKLYLTNTGKIPLGYGEEALNCIEIIDTSQTDTTEAIAQVVGGSGLKAYPNPLPRGSEVRLECRSGFSSLTVADLGGRVVVQRDYGRILKETSLELDLEPGIYLMMLTGGGHPGILKLLIE